MRKTAACLLIIMLMIGGLPLKINATEIYPDNYVDQTVNNDAQTAVDWLEELPIDPTPAEEEWEEINSIKPDTILDEFDVLREQMDKLRTGKKTTSKWIDSFGNGGNQDTDCLQFGGADNYRRIKANFEKYDHQIEQVMLDGANRKQFEKTKILTTEGTFVDGYRQEHDLSKLQVFSRIEDTIEVSPAPVQGEAESFPLPDPTGEQPNSNNPAGESLVEEKANSSDLEQIPFMDNTDEHQENLCSVIKYDNDEQQNVSETEETTVELVPEAMDLSDTDIPGSSDGGQTKSNQQMEDISGHEYDESKLTEEASPVANMEEDSLQETSTDEKLDEIGPVNTDEMLIIEEIETSPADESSLIEPNAVMSSSSTANWYDYNNYYGPKAINNGHVDQYSAFSSQEETINPKTGDLIIKTTDLYLPGRNGLDLEIGRMFQSNQAITGDRLSDTNGGCFTDYSTYNVDRYALGAGWSFTFPSVEVRGYQTEYEELFYHDGKGSVYHVEFTPEADDSNLENYYRKDISFNRNPNGGFILTRADQTKEFFSDIGTLYKIEDRFGNRIGFEYTSVMSMNRAPNFSFEHPENYFSWDKPAGFSYSTNGSLEFDYHLRFTGSTQFSSANSCIIPLKANTAYELRGYINNRLTGGGLAGIGYTLCDAEGNPLRSETDWVETTMASSWALPTIVFPSAGESRYVAIHYAVFYSSGGYAKLDGVQLCELTPVVSKITDSIGRQVTFDYDQYEYSIIEGLTDRQIKLTVSDPTTTDTYQLTYDLELVFGTYTGMVNGQRWAELRTFPVFNSFSNGEVTHSYIYDHATAFYSYRDWGPGVYPPGNASCTQLRLKEMKLPTTKVVYDYGSVIKHLGDHGFYQIDRIVGRSEVPNGSTTLQYHRTYSYQGTHGEISYDNETGWQPDTFDFEKSDHHDYFFTSTLTQDNGLTLHQVAQGGKDQSTEILSLTGESQKTTVEAYDPVFKNQPVKIRSDISCPQGSYTLYQGYTFNDWGGVETETHPLSPSEWDDTGTKEQNTITYQYNNDPVYKFFPKSKSYYQTPTRQLTEANNYDTLGRIVSKVNAKGEITAFEYDSNYKGNVIRTIINRSSGNNSITDISYADSSQKNAFPTAITQYYTDNGVQKSSTIAKAYHYLWGQPLSESDAQGNATSYEYDSQGRIKRIVYPASAGTGGTYTIEDHYDYFYPTGQNFFQVAYERLVNGTTSYAKNNNYYDSHGNLVKNEIWDDSINDWLISTNNFNNYGQVTSTIDPNDNETDYLFDEWDRLVAVTDTQGNQQVYQYNIGNRTNTSFFVPAGEVRENDYEETLDSRGRVAARRGFPNGINHTSMIEETYEYDLLGNCTKVTDPRGNSTSLEYDELNRLVAVENALGERSEYAYDQLGGISQVTQFDGPTQFNTSKQYDERGLLITKQEPMGTSYNYEHDSRGLLSKTTYPSSKIITYQYYPDGKLKLTSSGNSSTNILYHPLGAIEGYSCTGDGEGISYQYSSAGALKERKVAGKTVSFKYDQGGNLTQLTDPFGLGIVHDYDSLNRIQTITVDGKEFVYEYNGDGTIRSVTYPNGTTSEYTYDNINRLIGLTNKLGDNVLSIFAYNYDNNGNIIQISDNGSVSTYEYDAINRLVSTQNAQGVVRYAYDSRGNRMEISENGFKVPTLGTLEYNDWDQLSNYSKGSSSTGYVYDAEGLRTEKISSQGITRYHCNINGQVIAESNGSNQVTAQIIWGHKPLARKTGGQYYYYLYNGHGDVIGLIDETGNVVNSYAYDEWGNILSCQEQISNPIKYAGEYYDEESGLYYLRARYYDPAQGRFISKDSNEGNLIKPLSINQYSYCSDNPVGFVDINGCMPVYALNLYSSLYNSNKLTSRELTTAVFLENGLNVWTAFHEIAQLNIAKRLGSLSYPVELEYKIYSENERNFLLFKKVYEVDIVSGQYAWEVKAIGQKGAEKQLQNYLKIGGLKAGFYMQPIMGIPIIDDIKMKITFTNNGLAYYSFYRLNDFGETVQVSSVEVRNLYYQRLALATVAAGGIIGLTIAEDSVTGCLGIVDDIASFAAAMRAAAAVFGI